MCVGWLGMETPQGGRWLKFQASGLLASFCPASVYLMKGPQLSREGEAPANELQLSLLR